MGTNKVPVPITIHYKGASLDDEPALLLATDTDGDHYVVGSHFGAWFGADQEGPPVDPDWVRWYERVAWGEGHYAIAEKVGLRTERDPMFCDHCGTEVGDNGIEYVAHSEAPYDTASTTKGESAVVCGVCDRSLGNDGVALLHRWNDADLDLTVWVRRYENGDVVVDIDSDDIEMPVYVNVHDQTAWRRGRTAAS